MKNTWFSSWSSTMVLSPSSSPPVIRSLSMPTYSSSAASPHIFTDYLSWRIFKETGSRLIFLVLPIELNQYFRYMRLWFSHCFSVLIAKEIKYLLLWKCLLILKVLSGTLIRELIAAFRNPPVITVKIAPFLGGFFLHPMRNEHWSKPTNDRERKPERNSDAVSVQVLEFS